MKLRLLPPHPRKVEELDDHFGHGDRVELQYMRPLIVANNSGHGSAATMR